MVQPITFHDNEMHVLKVVTSGDVDPSNNRVRKIVDSTRILHHNFYIIITLL